MYVGELGRPIIARKKEVLVGDRQTRATKEQEIIKSAISDHNKRKNYFC